MSEKERDGIIDFKIRSSFRWEDLNELHGFIQFSEDKTDGFHCRQLWFYRPADDCHYLIAEEIKPIT